MKKQIFVGRITAKESKGGKTYYKGFVGSVPVVGFPKTDDDGNEVINLSLDVSTAQWITEQDVEDSGGGNKSGNSKNKSSEKPAESKNNNNTEEEEDVPF